MLVFINLLNCTIKYCRCLHTTGGALPFSPSKCSRVIQTCMRLHNLAIEERIPLYQGVVMVNLNEDFLFQGNPTQRARNLRNQVASLF